VLAISLISTRRRCRGSFTKPRARYARLSAFYCWDTLFSYAYNLAQRQPVFPPPSPGFQVSKLFFLANLFFFRFLFTLKHSQPKHVLQENESSRNLNFFPLPHFPTPTPFFSFQAVSPRSLRGARARTATANTTAKGAPSAHLQK